jgi:hypothetical protein
MSGQQFSPPPAYPQPAPAAVNGPVPPQASPPTRKPAWYRRTWVVAVVVGIIGITLGAATAGSTDPKTTPAYQSLAEERDSLAADLDSTQGDLDQTRSDLSSAQSDLETIAGDLPEREAAVKEAESAVAKREAAVTRAEQDVTKREKAVGIVETTIADNTISGEGMYKVGTDIKAGTYKTAGHPGCYYAVLNSTDTFDIANNNNIDGPAFVTVAAGQYLQLARCADWVWQQ